MRTRILILALVILLIGIAGPAPAQAPAQPTNAGPVQPWGLPGRSRDYGRTIGVDPFADIRAGVLHRLPIKFLGPRSSGSTSLRFCTYRWSCDRYSRTSSVREL